MASDGAALVRPALPRHWMLAAPGERALAVVVVCEAELTRRVFWMLAALHAAVWTAVPALTASNRPLDMIEMLYWGHHWQWGYHKHPPLPAWIAEVVSRMSGSAIWPLYLVAPLAVVISFWAAWTLAKEFLKPWPALCASALLEACAYYNITTADLNHTIVLQPIWALSALCLYRSLRRGQLRYWVANGACLGLGMLAKYDMALLVMCMLVLPAVNRTARNALTTVGPYLTLAVSLLIFAPHAAWMAGNHFTTVVYAVGRAETTRWLPNLVNPLEFALSQALALLPMAVIAYPLWRRAKQSAAAEGRGDELARDFLQRDFLVVVCLGPFVLDLLLSAVTGAQVQSMWGAPLWTFSGLCLIWFVGGAADAETYRRVIARCVIVGLVLAAILVARNTVFPYWRHKGSRVHFPGNQLAEVAKREWGKRTNSPISVVAGPWWAAANVGLTLPDPIEMYDFVYPEVCPWSGDEQLRKHGGIIVWELNDDGAKCATLVRANLPEAEILPDFSLRWRTGAEVPEAEFGMAILPPPAERRSHDAAMLECD